MDSLLELSVAAEVAAPHPGPASGFELTAAALLSPYPSDRGPDLDPPKPSELASFPLPTSPLTEELDLLIDKELETLTGQPKEGKKRSQYFSAVAAPLSSFPPPPVPQQALPELLQSSLGPGTSGDPSPIDQLSSWEEKDVKKEECVLNYSHLILPGESAGAKPNASLDLGATGRPSAFQIYKKTDTASESSRGIPSGDVGGVVRSKVVSTNMASTPLLEPRVARILSPQPWKTRVQLSSPPWRSLHPSVWDTRVRSGLTLAKTVAWHSGVSLSRLMLFLCRGPHCLLPHGPLPCTVGFVLRGRYLCFCAGLPGSGKSTLAWSVLCHSFTEGCCCWLHSPVNKL